MSKPEWPAWWEWELEQTSHLRKRMSDRSFTEVDLRHMLEVAKGFAPDLVPGRRAIETRHRRQRRAVIGLVVDLARDGRPIGVEITAPQAVTVAALNRVLRALGAPVVTHADLAPLRAA